jgi:hypothetical protein
VSIASTRAARRSRVNRMWPMGDDVAEVVAVPVAPESDGVVLRRIDTNVQALVASNTEEAERRKLVVIFGGIGVLIAAIKLGFIAVPKFSEWRSR